MISSTVSASRLRRSGVFAGVLALFLLASCSSYQRDFRKASLTKPSPSPTGTWKGTWKSEVNGHHGPLWCIITRDPSAPDTYNFRYRAGWGIFQFGDYTHRIVTQKEDRTLPLDHSMTLPKGFGTYQIEGKVTPEEFQATYSGEGDRGTLQLRRP